MIACIAPIFGVGIVRIAAAAGFDKNGYFSMALAMPILNMISFSCLDHSVWNVVDEDDVGVDDASANKNDICVDLNGDDAAKKVTNEEEKSNEYSKSNTTAKSDQVDETAKNTIFSSSTSMGEDYCRASSDSDEIRSLDLRQIEHDYEEPKKHQGSKKSFAKSIRVTLGSEMRPMTLKDYMLASKEMALTYWALYMVNNLASQFFAIGLYQPTLVASSTSYHDIEVGLTISTPLGTIFPKMDPHYLWIPVIGLVLLDVIGVIGVAYGAFPPMPVWAVYILSTLIYVLKYFVWLYTPLYVMQDKNLTSRYLEFQQQSLFLFVNTPYLLIDIHCFVWFQDIGLRGSIRKYTRILPAHLR